MQQQWASVLPQERALAARAGIREDAGALLLLQQQQQQPQSAQQHWASLGHQQRASLLSQQNQAYLGQQELQAPIAQVGIHYNGFDHEGSQLASSIANEDPYDPAFQTPVARSSSITSFVSAKSGSRPPLHSYSKTSFQISSHPPLQNDSCPSSAQMLPGASLVVTNTDDGNLFEEDFAEDTQMNHLFDKELLQKTIFAGGETQPTSDNVAPDFEGVSLDCIMQHLKLLRPDLLHQLKLKPFYKSYCSWEKLSNEQRNKAVSFFHKLPEPLRGKFLFYNLI
jgi:hypothetical protein